MINLLKTSVALIAFGLVLQGCRKDPPVTVHVDIIDSTGIDFPCDDFPPPPVLGWYYSKPGNQYHSPCFNPNNSNEFVFLKDIEGEETTQLIKYDLLSQTQTILTSTKIITSQPQWGKDGWIIFTVFEGVSVIYKIFENGSSMEQITDYNSFNPAFTTSGDRFVAMGGHPEIIGEYRPVLNLEGELVDSIRFRFENLVIGYPYISINETFKDSYQLFSDHDDTGRRGFGRLDDNNTFTEITSFFNIYPIVSVSNSSDDLFYTSQWGDIFKLNLNTLENKAMLPGCQTKYYHFISVSPNEKTLLVEKVFSTVEFESVVVEKHEIWKMDLDGKNEVKILGD